MNSIRFAAAFALPLLFFACQNNPAKDQDLELTEPKSIELGDMTTEADIGNYLPGTDTIAQATPQRIHPAVPATPQANPDWDKKIIRTASLQVEVKDYASYQSSLREKIRQSGGYIAQEEQKQSDYKIENSIVVKIPANQFDNAIALLTTGIEKITEKKISAQDVTAEVIDVKSRLEAKKQVRSRYLDFLKQAKNIEEILNVQKEINSKQEEIESAMSRISYLSHASTFSTIHLSFFQVLDISARDTREPSFWTRIAYSFQAGWKWTGDLIVGLISIWPVILFLGAVWVIVKRLAKSRAKPA